MQVRFHATLRQVVGGRLVEVPFAEGLTVSGLIDDLLTTYPALRPQLFDGDGQLHRHVHVFVNGRDAPYLSNGMDTVLGEDTNVDIFPPVGGGAR